MACPLCGCKLDKDSDSEWNYPFKSWEWIYCTNSDCDYTCEVPENYYQIKGR